MFDAAEYRLRADRARAAMDGAGLDALWVSGEANYVYLSGHRTAMFEIVSRPLFLLLPREGDPALVIARSHLPQAAATSWVVDQRGYEGFEDEAIAVLTSTIRDRGLAAARIGAELGHEQRPGITPLGLGRLRSLLPDTRFEGAAPLLWRLRAIKSAAEIALLRQAGAMTGNAYRRLFEHARIDTSERELARQFGIGAIEAGADRTGFFFIHSGEGRYQPSDGTPTDRRLENGDLLWMDGGAVCRGYWADFVRMASVGDPTPERRRRYDVVYRASRAVLAAIRPGVLIAQLSRICAAELAAAGEQVGNASRIGHGLGLSLTEPPSLNEQEPGILESGMVLAIEPTISAPEGRYVVEENVVVTEGGYELLSERAPPELLVI